MKHLSFGIQIGIKCELQSEYYACMYFTRIPHESVYRLRFFMWTEKNGQIPRIEIDWLMSVEVEEEKGGESDR